MEFASLDFAIFLPLVFILYWFVVQRNLKLQNSLILVSSYIFYGWWDWRFLSLIALSTVVDFFVGQKLKQEPKQLFRKLLLSTSIVFNLGLLGYFKYYNFFIESFSEAFAFFGHSIGVGSINIILPVGISFYTFQTLSYTIDVYRKRLEPSNDIISFAAFVAFFPQLVAGPIERATNLLPQFYNERVFRYTKGVDGMRQILWGLFKKVVIADSCAEYANLIFNNYQDYNGFSLILGALFFTFQIYGDFSGYSDIAIGTARLFGFNLMQNFATPYFSRDIAEFWRRWHISLSTWFRDYLYIPLGGSRGSKGNQIRNVFIIFIISGFWHGANWTFIVWGLLNAIYFLPLMLLKKNRTNISSVVAEGKLLPTFREILAVTSTFMLTVIAWIFFRAQSVNEALLYLKGILTVNISSAHFNVPKALLLMILFFLIIEWFGRNKRFALQDLDKDLGKVPRNLFYLALILLIFWFGGEAQEFIYFQF